MKLLVEYVPSDCYSASGKFRFKHLIAIVKSANSKHKFISLGLEKNQQALTERQIKWLETNEDRIIEVLDKLDLLSHQTQADYNNLKLKIESRQAFGVYDNLLTAFESDCEIISD